MLNRNRILDGLGDQARGGAISIGNFDGVHRGHLLLLERLRAMAARVRGPSVVVTFNPSPAAILRPQTAPPQLTTLARRTELLHNCGVDQVLVCQTTPDLLLQSPEQFFREIVVEELSARGMVEGANFFFGKDRAGTPERLRSFCHEHDVSLEIVEPRVETDRLISSTRIREYLLQGDVEAANRLLTAPYRLSGVVAHGAGRGREIGFPTANLDQMQTMIPGPGVYAGFASLGERDQLPAAIHIGPNPTFADSQHKVEVHLLDFQADVYQQAMQVDFIARIRNVVRFDSATALTEQLKLDILQARKVLTCP